jgi:glycosyltransferase involved in cell wall biosynthesis
MKVAFIVPGFSADENDWCIPAHTDIVKRLALTNEVHVYALRYPHRVDTYKIGEAVVHSLNGVGSRGTASVRLWTMALGKIARQARAGRFDMVHAIFGSEAGMVAVLAGMRLGIPALVWMVNGELIGLPGIGYGADLSPHQRRMNGLILRFAGRVLCGCDTMTATARARNSRARVETLPLGVNVQRFHANGRADRPPKDAHFVNVGSLAPIKDQRTLLNAFQLVTLRLPEARLTIAGVGPLEGDLRRWAGELGVSDRVAFAGYVPHDELADIYRDSDVFVQSSLHEGQGMALLEAAACGSAVCGTNVGILADLARARQGIVCEPGDAPALADAMLNAHRERVNFGQRARQIVARDFALELIARRLENLYARLKDGDDD